jgi:hypothetical protein
MEMIKIKAKKFILIILVVICMVFTSCSTNKQDKQKKQNNLESYNISTNFNLLNNGKSVTSVNIEDYTVELTLQIIFNSNVPFTLELGLIDNFNQRRFEIKEGDNYLEDDIFKLKLPETDEEFQESNIIIRVDKLKNNYHDLIFFIKDVTKIQSNSIRGYDFLRLNINSTSERGAEINYNTEVSFASAEEENVFLELNPNVKKTSSNIDCKLQFNIDKIYEGERFIKEYENHLNQEIDFVVMVLEDNKLLKINNLNQYAWSKSVIGKNGNIHFSATSNTTHKNDFVIILVPYPLLDLIESERYQLLAYNNICYYHYKFNESVELF